uniref:HU-CCDC81_euk_2 domain-containing protein n=1 Tax=Macrostomum lignano TaxID=282301 RepID=A0A1I8F763_9PLAT
MADGNQQTSRNQLSSRLDLSATSVSEEDLFHIWEAVSRFIEKNLQNQKGVHIPNFGTFSFVQKKLDVGNAKYLLPAASTCVRETLGALNRSIAMQRNVELVFCGVGRLQIRCG